MHQRAQNHDASASQGSAVHGLAPARRARYAYAISGVLLRLLAVTMRPSRWVVALCAACSCASPPSSKTPPPPVVTPPLDTDGALTITDSEPAAPAPLAELRASGVRACADPAAREVAWFDRKVLAEEPLAVANHYLLAGGGVAVADLDGDGRLDVFTPGERVARLFLQTAKDTFTERNASLQSLDLDEASGVSAADADGDGDLDLYVTRFRQRDVLLLNQGAGVFTDGTEAAGLRAPPLQQLTSAWGDSDGDGDLDLFVGRYGPADGVGHPSSDPSSLWLNQGAGTFLRADPSLPPEVHDGYTFMSAWVDLDLDRAPELLVINDFGESWPQRLLWNRPTGLVLDDGAAGLSLPLDGMGLASGDVNGDEVPDLLISSQYRVYLFESRDGAWFDTTALRGLSTTIALGITQHFGWSTELFDIDNDGDLDAFSAWGTWSTYDGIREQRDALWLQGDDGAFEDASVASGLADQGSTRGTVVADLNDDGWPDLVKRILGGPTAIYLSRCGVEGWLRVRLRGPGPNTHAIGARIRVLHGDRVWTRSLSAGGQGMFSGPPPEALFGLGAIDRVDRIEVHWPHGEVSVWEGVETRQVLDVTWVGSR
jgi:hypothetical protein